MEWHQKLETELLHYLSILLLGIYPKDLKVALWRAVCIPMITVALLTMANLQSKPKCPFMDKMDKENVIYQYLHQWGYFKEFALNAIEW